MGAFFSKHQYIVIWIAGLAIVGAFAVLIVDLNGTFLPNASAPQPSAGVVAPATPSLPPAPSVTLTLQQNSKEHSLMLEWQNLPSNTTALNIFRGKSASTSTWTLWKTIVIEAGQLNGDAQFDLGAADLGYEYYVQAVNSGGSNGGGGGSSGNGTSTDVLWTSNPTTPATSTTPVSGNSGGGGGGDQNNSGGSNNQSSTSSSTQNSGNNTSSSNSGAGNGNQNSSSSNGNSSTGGNNNGGGNGNAYYNPQIQVTGYGTANGDFWVNHVNQSIEVGWQNLPAGTTDIVVYRSIADAGPWNQLLEQENPGSTGSYSLQLVDGTLDDPYYYELTAFQGVSASTTYGPVYLPAAQ